MKWEEADARREKRKAEVREFLREAELLTFFDQVRSVFGEGVRIDWVKFGDRILGRDAYEASVKAARLHRQRVKQWHERTVRARTKHIGLWSARESGDGGSEGGTQSRG
jgi:hypothetical protein